MFKKPTPVYPHTKKFGVRVYRPILKKAWEITKQNKFLWILGLFAALAGNGGVYEIFIKGFGRVVSRGEIFSPEKSWFWDWSLFTFPRLEEVTLRAPLFVNFFWIIFLAVLIVLAVVIWLTTTGKGGLIHSVQKLANKKKTDFKDGWETGKKYFWPILGLNVLAKALTFSFLVLITIPVMFFITGGSGSFAWNFFLYILSFVVFTSLALFVSFMAIYASCFVVVKNMSFVETIRASWKMFIRNWLVSIEVALILFSITLVVGAAFILFSVLYLIPVFLLLIAFAYLELSVGFWLIVFLSFLGWVAALLFIGAVLSTFQFAAWTLLFLELNKRKIWSKLLRFIGIKK